MSAKTVSVPSAQLAREESAVTAFAVPTTAPAASASINGVPVDEFLPATRNSRPDYQPPATVVTVAASVPMSRDELVAALYYWEGTDSEELADGDHVRLLVAEAVVNVGLSKLADLVADIATSELDDDARAWLATCRRAVDAHFPAGPVAPVGAIPAPRPALRLVPATAPAVKLGPLTGAHLREVTAGLYFSDYQPGDLDRSGLEWAQACARTGLDGLTPAHVDWVHNAAPDHARMTDCRATARVLLDAQ
ncbi:hypothetical protein AB0425_16605 [Actinosynnema sp. NPDC051121]